MTQLPEVEVIRKDLEREIVGKRIKDVTVRSASLVGHQRNRPEFYKALEGRKIDAIMRRGTRLLLRLDDAHTLIVRLGSQATMTRETANREGGKDTQLVAVFTTGGALHYVDPDKDGEVAVVPTSDLAGMDELAPAGIDPLADQFTWPAFSRELVRRKMKLKSLLVDETFIIGLGDLYSDEILWTAGLDGARVSNTLSAQEVRRLYRAVLEVLYEAVKQGGTADAEGAQDEGDSGDFGDYIKVYGRAGLPCARCRQPISLVKIDRKRSSYHCINCQT